MIHVHVDVDNLWIYEKEYGVSFGKGRSFLFDVVLQKALDVFAHHNVKATFFIVGEDLEMESARKFCVAAINTGHAIANHTHRHRIDFGALSFEEKQSEIEECHNAIVRATGQRPVGFRAPGYYLDKEIIAILFKLGYTYDSSVLPGPANYFMKMYMKCMGRVSKEKIFGRNRYVFVSRKPCIVRGASKEVSIYEFPISVLPFLRSPAHSTFLFLFGQGYFNLMKMLYRISPLNHIYLFHAIDFMDMPDTQEASNRIIPLRRSLQDRIRFIGEVLSFLKVLSGGSIETIEKHPESMSVTTVAESWLLSYGLNPYSKKKV